MNPMEDTEFMGQMASFSTLEQVTNLATANEKIADQPHLHQRGQPHRPDRDVDRRRRRLPHRDRREGHYCGRHAVPDRERHRRCRALNHFAGRLGDKGVDAPMMRGMFAAISGLKTHQVMLDVTSNDIANVNTIGYKSARIDVQGLAHPAAARCLRRRRRHGRRQRGPDRPRHPARLDRQPDAGRRAAVDGQRRSTSPSRARACSASPRARAVPPVANAAADGVHPRGQLHHQQRGLPRDPGRLLRPGPHGRRRRHAARRSRRTRPTSRSPRTATSRTSTRRARA